MTVEVGRRLRAYGAALIVVVLVGAAAERWYLSHQARGMRQRISTARQEASARHPGGWQGDSAAVREVASLEYHYASVRRRLLTQWTWTGWTVRLLIVGGLMLVTGGLVKTRERETGSGTSS